MAPIMGNSPKISDYFVKKEHDEGATKDTAKSDTKGVRRSRDLGQQIVRQLQCMEEEYFDARQ